MPALGKEAGCRADGGRRDQPVLFPHGEVSDSDFREYCIDSAIELRRLVWEQLYTLDAEYRQYEEWIDYELASEPY